MLVPGPPRFRHMANPSFTAARGDSHGIAENRCKNRLGVFKRSVQPNDRALAVALNAAFTHMPGGDGPDLVADFAAALDEDREIFRVTTGARVLAHRRNGNLAEWRLRHLTFLAEDILDLGD